jgi:hypothetical protein
MRLNTKDWDKTFSRYMEFSKRDLAGALNAKAFFIARRAVVETPKAKLTRLSRATGAILGRIVNKRRGLAGDKGLYGAEMANVVEIIYAARRRSVAFLKSGWLPAIRKLEQSVEPKYRRGAARSDLTAKQVGQPKGSAIPARTGWRCTARIENAALATHDKKEALDLFGGPALQRAFDYEVQSMKEYIARKMRDTAKAAGIRTR